MVFGKVHMNLRMVLLVMMFKWGTFCSASSGKCLSAPCQNGATCMDTQEDYACLCPTASEEELRFMGKNCDQLYDACSFNPCDNCTSILGTMEYHCICPDGMAGDNCSVEVDECHSSPCSEPRSQCIDQFNGYFCRCPLGYGGDDCQTHVTDCVDEPCQNNGTCEFLPEGYRCDCTVGYDGEHCEEDVDECSSHPCQNGAICMDGVAEYHCFCVPGYQGYNCEIDINECASHPCDNNGTCINAKDHYECECLEGFTGVNCEVEIDECESDPCRNGATCHNLIGLYTCECPPGFEGLDCEVDIDECASEPCQNGGACHDMVDSYQCDCSDTGFMGDHCEEDILECSSDPCQHGATCLEGVKEYTCLCWPGYEGENCEIDIDECAEEPCENQGECFQRSDPSHWEMEWELNFADAAGYICQCQPGYAGENCSVDIDECESDPCQYGGTCEDQVNGFICMCAEGFTGDTCEVNIDDCESQPCENDGWCEDGVNAYTCHCPPPAPDDLPWGGQHCHVQLLGCLHHQCQNSATCLPWLEAGEHGHTCLCPHGYYGDLCSTPTTFSFSSPGFVLIDVSLAAEERRKRREVEPLQRSPGVRLRFRTTLPDMLLFYRGDQDNHLLLEISGGGLRAKAFSPEVELEVFFPGLVSDGGWRDVQVWLSEIDGLVLVLKGPGCDADDGCTIEDGGSEGPSFQPSEAFGRVYVGGAPEDVLQGVASGGGFVGCMEDLVVDSQPVVPEQLPGEQSHQMELGCSKTEWCDPEPCSFQGRCVDLWTSFHCDCYRPFHGHSCLDEFPSWTYSLEDSLSYSSYDVLESHGTNFTVSFFLRSLKPDGLLLQLRRPAVDGEGETEAYFSVYLRSGRILVMSLPDSAPLTAPIFVTTGEKQLLELEVLEGYVFLGHAELRYGLGQIPEVDVEAGDLAYVGGLPGEEDSEAWGGHFKGCLQDVRLDSVHLDVDAWNSSLTDSEEVVYLPSGAENVEPGCVSDDTCKTDPCLNGGECTVTWNNFICSCPEGYTGKTCETRVWCVSDPCVMGALCVDIADGYECVSNATFENNPVRFSAEGSLVAPVTSVYLELRTRSENAVVLRASHGTEMFLVGLLDSSVHVEIHSGNDVEELAFSGVHRVANGIWHRVQVSMAEPGSEASHWVITVDGVTDASSTLQLAGSLHFLNEEQAEVALAESFAGCLGAVRVGEVHLPFLDYQPPQPTQFHRVDDEEIHPGCTSSPVCHSEPCRNGGTCEDLFHLFSCRCSPGWEGRQCEVDTDECASGPCIHGDCKDVLAGFECECQAGYEGQRCEKNVDECMGHLCQHGGTCEDGVNQYTCHCPDDYAGPLCQWPYPPLQCVDVHCDNGGVCHEGQWGANCSCVPGYAGESCETEVDECESNPCRNGGTCLDRLNRFLCICPPGFNSPNCDTNKQAQLERVPWLVVAIPLVCLCVLLVVIGLTIMVLTARKKRQSEGAYSPSSQEVAGARLEMDSMLKVPPEERLI